MKINNGNAKIVKLDKGKYNNTLNSPESIVSYKNSSDFGNKGSVNVEPPPLSPELEKIYKGFADKNLSLEERSRSISMKSKGKYVMVNMIMVVGREEAFRLSTKCITVYKFRELLMTSSKEWRVLV